MIQQDHDARSSRVALTFPRIGRVLHLVPEPGFMPLSLGRRKRSFTNLEGDREFAFELPFRNRAKGVSALVRAKDEAPKIEHCLRSILPVFDEIVVVDNQSGDETVARVRAIQASDDFEGKIRLYSYPFRLARFGPEHAATSADSVRSAVYFTNWSLSRCSRRYVCKWDGDMVLLRRQREAFLRLLESLDRGRLKACSLAGQTVYRSLDRGFYAALGEVNREVEIFPCTYRCRFHKAEHWEQLTRPRTMRTRHFEPVCFYELKFLDEDEFDHWSTTEWPTDRKRREWENFHRLAEGRAGAEFELLAPGVLDDQVDPRRDRHDAGARAPGRASSRASSPTTRRGLGRFMPDFLGIGAMRSGTTWLATRLAAHPEIRMGRKEIHFFDQKLGRLGRPGSVRDRTNRIRYVARLLGGPTGEGIRGEFTPAYAILEPRIIERIAHWIPDVKLLFMMRDPIERAWSQARNDFPVWRGRPIEDVRRDELARFLDSDAVRRRSDYVGCLRRWLAVFPRDRFFFGFMDDVRDRPADLLTDVLSFLGADPEGLPPVGVEATIGASEPAPMPDWARDHLERSTPFEATELEEMIGREVPWAR